MTNGISTDGESRWCASWKRSSGSPAKSLSTITRARGGRVGYAAPDSARPFTETYRVLAEVGESLQQTLSEHWERQLRCGHRQDRAERHRKGEGQRGARPPPPPPRRP